MELKVNSNVFRLLRLFSVRADAVAVAFEISEISCPDDVPWVYAAQQLGATGQQA